MHQGNYLNDDFMKRLVIIEDDISTLEIFNIIFSSAYHLNCFNNGKAIYNRRFEIPDLFLIDRILSGHAAWNYVGL